MSLFGSGGRKQEDAPAVRQSTGSGAPQAEVSEEPSRKRLGGGRRSERSNTPNPSGGKTVANLGKSIVFKGDLTGDEDLEIEGRVEGQVKLPNHQLTVGAHGRVTAQVEAKHVVVIGHIAGDVIASERVEVQATGIVDGDIHAPRLLVQEGAVVNGSIEMGGAAAPKASGDATTKPPQSNEAPRKTG